MSVGPMGMAGSVAGSVPQIRSAAAEKTQQQATDQTRKANSDDKAEQASGVGETEQDEQASDRDADGRKLWEGTPESEQSESEQSESEQSDSETPTGGDVQQSRDPSGERGSNLDLSG